MTEHRLTGRELDVMSALWELGEATVNELRDRIDPQLAYTTVSSVVRLLELKGYVSHRQGEGKTHVYHPVIAPESAGTSALGRIIDKIYGGSPVRLLAHLLEDRKVSEEELARMRELLRTPRKKR